MIRACRRECGIRVHYACHARARPEHPCCSEACCPMDPRHKAEDDIWNRYPVRNFAEARRSRFSLPLRERLVRLMIAGKRPSFGLRPPSPQGRRKCSFLSWNGRGCPASRSSLRRGAGEGLPESRDLQKGRFSGHISPNSTRLPEFDLMSRNGHGDPEGLAAFACAPVQFPLGH
jgi:hypothetical protein